VVAEVEVEAGEEQLLRVPSLVLVPVPVHEVVRQVEAQAVGAAAAEQPLPPLPPLPFPDPKQLR